MLLMAISLSFFPSVHFNDHFSRWTWVSQCQTVSILDFIGAKGDGGGGDNWSYKTSSQIITTNKPYQLFFTDWMPFV